MIKNFKIFEKINTDVTETFFPKRGEYVLLDISGRYNGDQGELEFTDYVRTHIGYVKSHPNNTQDKILLHDMCYAIRYDGIRDNPDGLRIANRFLTWDWTVFYPTEIKYWSSNKEDLQKILKAEQFDL